MQCVFRFCEIEVMILGNRDDVTPVGNAEGAHVAHFQRRE